MGIEYKDILEWEVETPTGWKSFAGVKKVDKNQYVEILFENGKIFKCSIGHKLKRKDGKLIETRSIRKGNCILGKNGILEKVVYKRKIKNDIDLFDLIEVDDGHVYFTDDIISSNCAFIEGIEEIWLSAQYTLSCVDKNHLILTNNGLVRFKDLINKNTKIGFNEISSISLPNKNSNTDTCSKLYKSDLSDLYKVNFKSGNFIIGTKVHPLYTKQGWKSIEQLSDKDCVLTIYNQNTFGKKINYSKFKKLSFIKNFDKNDLIYLCGVWLSNDNFESNNIQIKNIDIKVETKLLNFGFEKINENTYQHKSEYLKKLFDWLNINKSNKQIPSKILGASKKEQLLFIKGLFDVNTSINCCDSIKFKSTSDRLILDLRSMLLNIGIYSVIKTSKKSPHVYTLYINKKDSEKFYNQIELCLKDECDTQFVNSISNKWDNVTSIEFYKNDYSYDLKVDQHESFICEGILNHNTGGRSCILSTPNGVGGFFHKTWIEAEEGKNKFNTIRLPWYLHPDRDQAWRDKQTQLSGVKGAAQECDCLWGEAKIKVKDVITNEIKFISLEKLYGEL